MKINQTRNIKRSIKRKLLLLGTAACLAGSGGYGTITYMQAQAQTINHLQFAGEDGMDAVLEEPSWKPEKGRLTVPGTVIPKDPVVTNTSKLPINELVALRCEFVYTDSCPDRKKAGKTLSDRDMKKVSRIYEIDYNSDLPEKGDWVRFSGQTKDMPVQYFYYKKVLKKTKADVLKGETTAPLFTGLKIGKSVNNREFSGIQEIDGFDIRITGFVIQQMDGDQELFTDSPEKAYEAGLFAF